MQTLDISFAGQVMFPELLLCPPESRLLSQAWLFPSGQPAATPRAAFGEQKTFIEQDKHKFYS